MGMIHFQVIRSTSFNKNNQTKQNGEWKTKKKIENQNVYLIDIRGKGYQKGDTFSKCGKERKTVAGRMMSWGEPRVIWMNVKRKGEGAFRRRGGGVGLPQLAR